MELTFIAGGVRSGKSAFAENLALSAYKGDGRLVYMASGVAMDSEMKQRIARHQKDRATQPVAWHTIEAPLRIGAIMNTLREGDVVLWDCVTTWLTNMMYMPMENKTINSSERLEEARMIIQQAFATIQHKNITFFVVSNELFDEPDLRHNELNHYRKVLGDIHQWLVEQAKAAYELTEGIAKKWK